MPRPKQPGLPIELHVPEKVWAGPAACRGSGAELFFSEDADDRREAKAICAGCSIRSECLERALALRDEHGIWGGFTWSERKRILRRRNVAA